MSGYLQRLARNVMQPAESVHPLLGSMFAPPQYPGASVEEENVTAISSFAAPARDSEGAREVRDTQQTLLMPPLQLASSPPLPAEGRTAHAGPTLGERNLRQTSLVPTPDEHSSARAHKPQPDAFSARKKQERDEGSGYTPLLGENLTRPVSPSIPTHNWNASPPAAPGKEQPSSAPRAQHEPDEIQIHIGRIEVTALQQAPARAPQKPGHKGPSLDEYLSRRDRRA